MRFELLEEDHINVKKNTYFYDYDVGSAEVPGRMVVSQLLMILWQMQISFRIFRNCLLEIWIMSPVKCHGLFREITVRFGLQCRS